MDEGLRLLKLVEFIDEARKGCDSGRQVINSPLLYISGNMIGSRNRTIWKFRQQRLMASNFKLHVSDPSVQRISQVLSFKRSRTMKSGLNVEIQCSDLYTAPN